MEVELTGPGIWFINIAGILVLLMAIFVCVDPWRPARAERLPDAKTRLVWVLPQAVFVAATVAAIIPGVVPGEYRWIVLALTPVAAILQVSYLLKVVFPKLGEEAPTASGD